MRQIKPGSRSEGSQTARRKMVVRRMASFCLERKPWTSQASREDSACSPERFCPWRWPLAVWCMHLTFPSPLPSIPIPALCPVGMCLQFISLCLNRSFACLSQISPCLLNKLELSSGEQTKALNQLERVLLFKNLKVSLLLPLLSPFLFIYLNVYM